MTKADDELAEDARRPKSMRQPMDQEQMRCDMLLKGFCTVKFGSPFASSMSSPSLGRQME